VGVRIEEEKRKGWETAVVGEEEGGEVDFSLEVGWAKSERNFSSRVFCSEL